MARNFWERIGGNKIQFYGDPQELFADEIDQRISELQGILSLSDATLIALGKRFIALEDSVEIRRMFTSELIDIADRRDYFSFKNVLVSDMIQVVDHRWMSPSEMTLGPGVLVSFSGEEVANPATNAIDGRVGTNWQHDVNQVHELVINLGYPKRIDGIRIRNPSTLFPPFQLSGVDVFTSFGPNGLDDPKAHVGANLSFLDPGDNDRDLMIRNAQYIKLTVQSTAHGQNHITIRDIEFRTRPKTFNI